MATFNVTYPDGSQTVETVSDCNTVEQFLNARFGTSSGRDKAKVEMVPEAIPGESKVEEPKPKAKK